MTGSVSSPSFNGQVFIKPACAYEFIKLIPELASGPPKFQETLVCYAHSEKSHLFFSVNGLWRNSSIFLPIIFSSDLCTVLCRKKQVAIKYDCYFFSCLLVIQQIVFEGFIYFNKCASKSSWKFLQQYSTIKNIMGIFKDIRYNTLRESQMFE